MRKPKHRWIEIPGSVMTAGQKQILEASMRQCKEWEGTMAVDHQEEDFGDEYIILSTGRQVAAWGEGGIVGIGPDLRVYAGYDDEVCLGPERKDDGGWTVAEKRELAEFMLKRWLDFWRSL